MRKRRRSTDVRQGNNKVTAILKRKLAAAQRSAQGGAMTALRALRLSVARAGDDLHDLPLGVVGGRQSRLLPDDLEGILSDDDLLIVLDCPGGMTGAVSLQLSMVASVIQQQTMGQVAERAPDPRAFTETDAAMCAPLIEGMLSRARDLVEGEGGGNCFQGLRFGARGEDVRSLLLALRARRYRVFWLTLDIALGRHQSELVLVLPDTDEDHADPSDTERDAAQRAGQSPMLDVPTEVRAVLARFRLPVSTLNGLRLGDTLPVPRDRLDETTLISVTGRVVARGRLGQMNGHRALRLMAPRPIPRVPDDTREAAFDPRITASLTPDPMMAAGMNAGHSDLAGLADDMSIDSLAALSAAEAAHQITELAGLTAEDLAAASDPEPTGGHVPTPAHSPGPES